MGSRPVSVRFAVAHVIRVILGADSGRGGQLRTPCPVYDDGHLWDGGHRPDAVRSQRGRVQTPFARRSLVVRRLVNGCFQDLESSPRVGSQRCSNTVRTGDHLAVRTGVRRADPEMS